MANRKLMMEMDRTSKETTRALQEYDEINKKLSQSLEGNHTTRSEKLFLDLKRDHLGKVIRLRHQIKVWLDGNDADHIPFERKQALGELKTMCEQRMEEFDKRERLYKTRGFRKDDMEADNETISWVKQMCEEMRKQKEVIEGELEMQKKDEDLQHRLLAFTYHLFHLELILRGLTNQALDEKEIDELKRDLQEFINGDLDLDEDSDFYAHLDLNSKLESFIDEVTVFAQPPASLVQAATAPEPTTASTKKQTATQKKSELKKQQETAKVAPAPPPPADSVEEPSKTESSATKVMVDDKRQPQQQPTAWQSGGSATAPSSAAPPPATPTRLPSFPPRSRLVTTSTTPLVSTPLPPLAATPLSSQQQYASPYTTVTPGGTVTTRLPNLVKVAIPPLPQRLLASPLIASPSSVLDAVSDDDLLIFLDQSRNNTNFLNLSTPTSNSSSKLHLLSPHLLFKPLPNNESGASEQQDKTGLSEEEDLMLRLDVADFLRSILPANQQQQQQQQVERVVIKCAVQNGARVELGQVQLAPFAIQLQKEGLDLDVRQRIIKELRDRKN